ncbi:MAG: hypothetical protein ABI778_00820 [Ignavibacteriota bacterium]
MKRTFSLLAALAFISLSGSMAFSQAQRTLGGTRIDLDDNTGNHVFLSNAGSSLGVNATGLAPNPGALLDLFSTTKGLLIPRMNAGQEAGVSTIAGMMLFNTTTNSLDVYNGSSWTAINGGWALSGNTGTNPISNYIGTNDIQDFVVRTTGAERLRVLSGGNVTLSSTAGTAINISGPAATSISAAGTIQTSGDFKTGPSLDYTAVAGDSKIGLVRGTVNSGGAVSGGFGFSSTRTGVGAYTVTIPRPSSSTLGSTPSITVSAFSGTPIVCVCNLVSILFASSITYSINTFNLAGALTDSNFMFTAEYERP